jgi:uncharacterized phiE125 gp8 family phage protein
MASYELSVIEPATELAVTVEDLATELNLNMTPNESLLTRKIRSATGMFELLTGGRVVMPTRFRQYVSHLCGPVDLMAGNISSVEGVYYYDADDELTQVDHFTAEVPACPCPVHLPSYPAVNLHREFPAYVEFTAGFQFIPDEVLDAILQYAVHLYEQRSIVVTGTIVAEIPLGFRTICELYRTGLTGTWRNSNPSRPWRCFL